MEAIVPLPPTEKPSIVAGCIEGASVVAGVVILRPVPKTLLLPAAAAVCVIGAGVQMLEGLRMSDRPRFLHLHMLESEELPAPPVTPLPQGEDSAQGVSF